MNRPVLMGDVIAVARVLLARPAADRAAVLAALVVRAGVARRLRQATGRPHPLWGSGSLMGAARAWPRAAEPFADDPDYAACLRMVLAAAAR